LRVVSVLQPVSAGDLARKANIGYATLTGILDRLEKRGFVVRARDPADRRTVIVTVTEAGEQVLARAPSLLQKHLRQELGRMPDEERASLLQTLARIADLMEADSSGGAKTTRKGPVDAADRRAAPPQRGGTPVTLCGR
jgi:DNA-binding MarR family transcriptional regulator